MSVDVPSACSGVDRTLHDPLRARVHLRRRTRRGMNARHASDRVDLVVSDDGIDQGSRVCSATDRRALPSRSRGGQQVVERRRRKRVTSTQEVSGGSATGRAGRRSRRPDLVEPLRSPMEVGGVRSSWRRRRRAAAAHGQALPVLQLARQGCHLSLKVRQRGDLVSPVTF